MNRSQPHSRAAGTPLRLWPGIAAAALLLVLRFGVKAVVPDFAGFAVGMMTMFAALFAIVVWWLFFSRARWIDRAGGLAMLAAAVGVTLLIGHESMGVFWLFAYGIPTFAAAFVAAIVASRRLADGPRRVALAAALLLVSGIWVLFRTEGVSGDHYLMFSWRWTASPEERLLASSLTLLSPTPSPAVTVSDVAPAPVEPVTAGRDTATLDAEGSPASSPAGEPAVSRQVEWPGFRGAGRDGVVRNGVPIATDWSASPLVEMWRRPVGPGWSSLAVSGGLIYTQEQRGDDEVVAAYRLASGEPVWVHRTAARFFEPMAGAGPRSTPEVRDGRVFTFGATGIVTALDAATGRRLWSRDGRADADVTTPNWGFASSPLVVGDLLIVAVSGRLVAYDLPSGMIRWLGSPGGEGYSSPHLLTLGGTPQIILVNGGGVSGVSPADGAQLWAHPGPGFSIVQPAIAGSDLLVAVGGDAIAGIPTSGVQRVAIARGPAGWTTRERWTSVGLKPYFNDFIVHEGHAYGFDGRILSCIDLATGERVWKGGRYGNGQLVLLPDQDLLLVLSEEGEIALVSATPGAFREISKRPAIQGKTWNHPVVVGDLLLVRNGEEMAAFRLPPAGR
jgi:outer membrane protein assembly factor BamB